jgi:hypothetical protein
MCPAPQIASWADHARPRELELEPPATQQRFAQPARARQHQQARSSQPMLEVGYFGLSPDERG